MKKRKLKTFSSAREIFNTYLPKSTQEGKIISPYAQEEDIHTNELLEHFRSSLEKQTRRKTSQKWANDLST